MREEHALEGLLVVTIIGIVVSLLGALYEWEYYPFGLCFTVILIAIQLFLGFKLTKAKTK